MDESPFIDPLAVEAWDAWFRWREAGSLRDETLDATWLRVATALASVEADGAVWLRRFRESLGNWHVLPDERVLATAGTHSPAWRAGDPLVAVVNVASLVHAPFTRHAWLDAAELGREAGMAVRMLDNAGMIVGGSSAPLQVGLIGVADALEMLGVPYASSEARGRAAQFARALAEGCLRASVQLAEERGPDPAAIAWQVPAAMARGLDEDLIARARRDGVRHVRLTAITSHPRLAMLANNASDALDPLPRAGRVWRIEAPDGARLVPSLGYARTLLQRRAPGAILPDALAGEIDARALAGMRSALQPWIDEPISDPLPSAA